MSPVVRLYPERILFQTVMGMEVGPGTPDQRWCLGGLLRYQNWTIALWTAVNHTPLVTSQDSLQLMLFSVTDYFFLYKLLLLP